MSRCPPAISKAGEGFIITVSLPEGHVIKATFPMEAWRGMQADTLPLGSPMGTVRNRKCLVRMHLREQHDHLNMKPTHWSASRWSRIGDGVWECCPSFLSVAQSQDIHGCLDVSKCTCSSLGGRRSANQPPYSCVYRESALF